MGLGTETRKMPHFADGDPVVSIVIKYFNDIKYINDGNDITI